MTKYRIKKITNGTGETHYQPQRKLTMWLPFWEDIRIYNGNIIYGNLDKGMAENIIQYYRDNIDNKFIEYIV